MATLGTGAWNVKDLLADAEVEVSEWWRCAVDLVMALRQDSGGTNSMKIHWRSLS